MNQIEKIRDNLYIKKSFDGYNVVYPIKKDIEQPYSLKNLHWFNLLTGGNYWKLAKTLVVLFLILGVTWSYMRDIKVCKDIADYAVSHPCEWCSKVSSVQNTNQHFYDLNLTFIKEVINNESPT